MKVLDKSEIIRLLKELDKELAAHGDVVSVYVVGGANIALTVDGSRSTTDIDVVVRRGMLAMQRAATAVAGREKSLGADWINAQFTGQTYDGGMTWSWFDNKDSDIPTTFYQTRNLRVELASPEMMLALKTIAGRPQDLPDIYKLMRITGVRTPLELGRNLARFTGKRIFEAQGTVGMYLHIDPQFSYIFSEAPPDLAPNTPLSTTRRALAKSREKAITKANKAQAKKERQRAKELASLAQPRCGRYKVKLVGGKEVSRTQPCVRPGGHFGPHRGGR